MKVSQRLKNSYINKIEEIYIESQIRTKEICLEILKEWTD